MAGRVIRTSLRFAARRRVAALAAASALALAAGPGCAGPSVEARTAAPPAPLAEPLEARCRRGFAPACRDLGRSLLAGGARDDRLAAALATKACELGEASACADLGVLTAVGRGVSQDDARAVALSRRACDAGAAQGCANLAALAAAGAPVPARPDEPADVRVRAQRLARTACDGGAPEGCLGLAALLQSGEATGRDLPAAARALRRACEAGLAVACYRLGLLAEQHPEATPGVGPAGLHATACQAAIAPACDLAGQKVPPSSARTPTARLVGEPTSLALGIPGLGGIHPADLTIVPGAPRTSPEQQRRPPASLLDAVPPAARGRLQLTAPARPGDGADAPVDLLVSLRRQQLGGCYELPRQHPGQRTELFVIFLVGADGRPTEVRAAGLPADAELEACAADLVTGWEFPVPPGGLGGPHLVSFTFEAAPAGPPPQFQPPGGLRPSLRQPGCLERHLRVPPEYRGTVGVATVKLAVDGSGTPFLLHAVTPAPEPLLAAIGDAVRACEWSPGAEPSGRRATLWVTVPVHVDGR